VLLFEGTDQPTGGPEGDAQDLGQLADGGHGLRGRAEAMNLGADVRMVAEGSGPGQGLRAEGADQRDAHRGGDDPADAQAASESSVKNQSAGIMMP
jgi:hypothetical protein